MTKTVALVKEAPDKTCNRGALDVIDKVTDQLFAVEIIQKRLDDLTNLAGQSTEGAITLNFGELFKLNGALALFIRNINTALNCDEKQEVLS